MDLSNEQTANSLEAHVEDGGSYAEFAAEHGVSRATLNRRLAKLPALRARLEDARIRSTQLETNAGRAAEMMGVGPRALGRRMTRDEYLDIVEGVMLEPDHVHWPHAARMLGAWHLEPEMVRRRRAAELVGEAESRVESPLVVLAIPAAPEEPRVIDAEVVERDPRTDS